MKPIYSITRNRGVGLIEVLIATVVIALGLLAVASMQGNFMSESATNKTRAEAMKLAEQKIEELRNHVTMEQFKAPQEEGAPTSDTLAGTNATFTRSWQIDQGAPATASPPPMMPMMLTVNVSWGDAADEQVALTTQIDYARSNTAAELAVDGETSHQTGPGTKAPSPNVRSSERAMDVVELFDQNGKLNAGFSSYTYANAELYQDEDNNLYRRDGGGYPTGRLVELVGRLTPFDIDLRYEVNNADTLPADPIRLYTKRSYLDSDGKLEVIDLYTLNMVGGIGDGSNMLNAGTNDGTEIGNTTLTPDGTATRVHRYFGGVILRIQGTVYTVETLDDIKIDHNREDMYCVYNPGEEEKLRKYACYPGGSCENGPSGLNSDVTQCANPAVADARVGPGGWRGNVGLINVNDEGGGKERVCHYEEIENINSPRTTARKYKGLLGSQEQGINESYNCQDFLIVVVGGNNFNQLASECGLALGTFDVVPSLPTKEVVRNITGQNAVNTVAGANNSFCNNLVTKTYSLTITVTNATSSTTVKAHGSIDPNTGTSAIVDCTPTTALDATPASATFSCSGASKANVLTISGVSTSGDQKSGFCYAELDVNEQNWTATGSCEMTLLDPPTYTLNGTIYCKSGNTLDGTCSVSSNCPNSTGQNVCASVSDRIVVFNKACTISGTTFSCVISTLQPTASVQATKGNNSISCSVPDLNLEPGQSGTINNACILRFKK
ncbi:MAG: hypothetical protein IBX56_05695 [Methylomicrobium sp.]|nr:hypothetical protein [Methylomicrobium sp.]